MGLCFSHHPAFAPCLNNQSHYYFWWPLWHRLLDPIKTRSTEMYEKAVAVSKSTVPMALKGKKGIKEAVAELVKGTKELDALIKTKSSDEVIKTKLTSLHDTFHKIIETCNKEDEKH